MKVLITGGGGFVGSHLVKELRSGIAADIDIAVTSKDSCDFPWGHVTALDVVDGNAVRSLIAAYRPTHVIHLAGVAAPKAAQADPESAWKLHVTGALNVAHAVLDLESSCAFIHIGSGLVYGDSAKSGLPLDETALLAPVDDYAVTKAAGDLAVGALAHRGLKVLRMRPFNHAGPGQSEAFVISAFAAQVAKIEAGKAPPLIRVGNLDSERDFLDVRDVVRSYLLAVEKSDSLREKPIFNIALEFRDVSATSWSGF